MKVLHLLASPYFTGPAELVVELALAQRRLGHDVTVAIDRKRTAAPSEELAAPRLEALGLAASAALQLSVKSNPVAMMRDVLILRDLEVDVVHAHFSHDHLLARLGRPKGARLVRSIHAPRSLRWSLPQADAWTVPTAELARRLVGSAVLVLPPIVSSDFGPPVDRQELRRALGLPPGPVVGMVSTFQPSRRHALGLEAFAALRARRPDAHLALVGDGKLEPELRSQVEGLGLASAVTFAGYQPRERFVRWLQALDEVWVLGLGNDFSARAAAQARACGVRVVAVDEGALERYADALVPPDASAVAGAALTGEVRPVVLEPGESIARRVLELYETVSRPADVEKARGRG
ncbi:MAG: glycosyltransferase [Myxococcota bacterium]